MRVSLLLIALMLAGCASSPEKQPPRRPGIDQLCFNDCLGAGTSKEFCEERCSY